jgi:hypothetical protein
MQLRPFLSAFVPVAARNPQVFLEAVLATCTVQDSQHLGRRVMVTLKTKVRQWKRPHSWFCGERSCRARKAGASVA